MGREKGMVHFEIGLSALLYDSYAPQRIMRSVSA